MLSRAERFCPQHVGVLRPNVKSRGGSEREIEVSHAHWLIIYNMLPSEHNRSFLSPTMTMICKINFMLSLIYPQVSDGAHKVNRKIFTEVTEKGH